MSDVTRYRPPALPKKNLSGLSIGWAIIGRTPSGIIYLTSRYDEKFYDRVLWRGGHAQKIPDTIALAMASGEDVSLPPGVDLCILVAARQEEVPDPTIDATGEFRGWVRSEYPKAVTRSGEVTVRSLMLHYEVVMDVVRQRYEQKTKKKPYPLISKITGLVSYRDRTGKAVIGGREFASDTIYSVHWGTTEFWDRLIEDSIKDVHIRSRKGSTQIRCPGGTLHDIGRYIELPATGAQRITRTLKSLRNAFRRKSSYSRSVRPD